jgi:valyl-tRNA synthetase
MTELATRFNFREIEQKWCGYWEAHNTFHGEPNPQKPSYSIVIPPPNVTGILHMGHALNNTLQDIIIRYKRMQGFETCWMPGTDHAGIATQNVVEKELAKEGKTRHDVGREDLLRRLWEWKRQYGDTIINQLKRLGCSCDWQRTRFTMDDHYSSVVKHVFVHLFQKGIIYRGQYIINWCPRCQTALSDEEAEHREHQGRLYHLRYPLRDSPDQFIVVATTRPETMLGDTAVAVHPRDKRYKNLIGQIVRLPLLEREIPIIADDFVDPKFGTGAVKVTPAHDPNDFEMGKRHQLAFINIMHPDGRLNANAGEFAEMDRFEAREAVLEDLAERNLLAKDEPHVHAIGHCYRCHTVVEPYLSKQWFVRMQPLAAPALRVVKDHQIRFIPSRWTKVYQHWMGNIRDWCISRQIWWGHRIPVWYCHDCPEDQNIIVQEDPPHVCPHCQKSNLRQDEDVLDTWFSSWLWPFATFGWPENKQQTDYFYPTASLFTASEIIFFWVARMIMAGLEFMGKIPFKDVYIHGTVRDAKGIKMSKSLGNAIDPIEIINEYGADALRFSLIINSGLDLYISKEKFEIGRNFANKLWNAARLVLLNVTERPKPGDFTKDLNPAEMDLPSRWIVSQFFSTLTAVNRALEAYRFSEAENLIYEFFWHNFCDWYLEIIKSRFAAPQIQTIAYGVLEQSLRMIHPFMPFVTEEIWAQMERRDDCLSLQSWPKIEKKFISPKAVSDMNMLREIVVAIRNLRVQWNIRPQQALECLFETANAHNQNVLDEQAEVLKSLAGIDKLLVDSKLPVIKDAATGVVGNVKFYLPLSGIIDLKKERDRINEQIQQQQNMLKGICQRLSNKDFLKKAPKEVVAKDQERVRALENKIAELQQAVRNLQ